MSTHYKVPEKGLLKIAQCLNWFTKEQLILWLFENTERSRRIEILLPRLVNKKKLVEEQYHKRKVYIVPRLGHCSSPQIEHGLGVTEGLIRFYISDRTAEIIPSRKFVGCGVRPEFGLKYPNSMFLYEFCTQDNSKRLAVLQKKVNSYKKMDHMVVFVMDIPRLSVIEKIKELKPEGKFMFTDYETFKNVPFGKQLTAPIYLWEDLNVYPLRHEPDN
jgi:hypothetical protein